MIPVRKFGSYLQFNATKLQLPSVRHVEYTTVLFSEIGIRLFLFSESCLFNTITSESYQSKLWENVFSSSCSYNSSMISLVWFCESSQCGRKYGKCFSRNKDLLYSRYFSNLCLCIRGGRCRRRGSARWRRSWPSPWWCGSPGWAGAHTTPGGSWGPGQTRHPRPRTVCRQNRHLVFKNLNQKYVWVFLPPRLLVFKFEILASTIVRVTNWLYVWIGLSYEYFMCYISLTKTCLVSFPQRMKPGLHL